MSFYRNLQTANLTLELRQPLTFTARQYNSLGFVSLVCYGNLTLPEMYYRYNNGGGYSDWKKYDGEEISLAKRGSSVQFWNHSEQLSTGYENYASFKLDGDIHVHGNIQSLLNWREDCPKYCFFRLFKDNNYITNVPILPATTVGYRSYREMFMNDYYITGHVTLPAETLGEQCYYNMFYRCRAISSVAVNFTTWTDAATYQWLRETAESGVFYKPSVLPTEFGNDKIPVGWTVRNIEDHSIDPVSIPLTFTAEEDGATVTLNVNGALAISGMKYRTGTSGTWYTYTAGTPISLPNTGDVCQFMNTENTLSTSNSDYAQFSLPKKVSAKGNVMSLVGMITNCPTTYCFVFLFKDCTGLTTPPILPAPLLTDYCYSNMFSGCSNLSELPALPATELATACYLTMFAYCSKITSAADLQLPALVMKPKCYQYMFAFCNGLVSAPYLPSVSLADRCYYAMFRECKALAHVQEVLPATELATYCYYAMFGDSGLSGHAPEIPYGATFQSQCCVGMFQNSKISSVSAYFTTWSSHLTDWVLGVKAPGTFYKPSALPEEYGANRIPTGWTVVNID